MTTGATDSHIMFNDKTIERLPSADKGKRAMYLDKRVEGLGLRVTDSGGKSFSVFRWFKGKPIRITLGKFRPLAEQSEEFEKDPLSVMLQKDACLDTEQARKVARIVVAQLDAGNDIRTARAEAQGELTFAKLFERYINEYAKPKNKRWQLMEGDYQRYFLSWSDRRLSTITPEDVQAWVNELSERGKHTANRQYNALRAVISWGMKKRIINMRSNPCIGADLNDVSPRERFVLPGDEFNRLADAINKEPKAVLRDFFWMSLFTGARKTNVLAMEWSEINEDLQTWTIPGSKMKNGHSLTLTLTTEAMGLLRSRNENTEDKDPQWVFPGDGKTRHLVDPKAAWKRILDRAKIQDLRIHDLRRTVGSYMAIQGISPTIIGKALGHRSPQATAVYARLTQDPVRQALESVQAALSDPTKLVSPQKQNVVPLKKTAL